jgi:hypothetical protein
MTCRLSFGIQIKTNARIFIKIGFNVKAAKIKIIKKFKRLNYQTRVFAKRKSVSVINTLFKELVGRAGIEPATRGLRVRCSTN